MDQDNMEDVEEIDTTSKTAELLRNNPELVAAVQAKLNGLVGMPSGFIDTLPQCVKNRLNALKNVQVQCAYLEGQFYEEAHQLEMKYAELFKPLYDKRSQIVNCLYEPNEEESKWVEPGDEECEEDKDEQEEKSTEKSEKTEDEKMADTVLDQLKLDENTKGIPEFWLTAMRNVELIEEMIQEQDEPLLKHLTDVKLIFTGKKADSDDEAEMGFVLEFHFSSNDYFTNTALTKTYRMKSEPDKDDPFSFDGPDIFACTGCKIDWKKGKNITEKQVKKKQKHKGRGQTRIITKMVKTDSFFNFFDPPEIPEDEEDLDEETEALLAVDFEIGHFFRERLIPKAVLFYTGEAIEEDSDEEDDDEETTSDEDDDDDEDEDEDPDYKPQAGKEGEKPEECKQQ
jgi:nucleosome assembly protein 1-like 1